MMGATLWVVPWLVIFLVVVWGQNSNVEQCIPSYSWTINRLNQSPCLVAAYLESGCGMPARVDGIPSGTHYTGPLSEDANGCYCSSVTYSAISACAGCQDRSFLNWTMWSYNCTTKYVASYPGNISAATFVPQWLYLNPLETNDTFDPVVAARNVSIILPSTLFPTKTVATATVSFLLSDSPTPTRPASNTSNPNLGAIVGGALGGSVGVAIILLLLLLWYLRRRSDRRQRDLVFDRTALVSGPSTTSGTSSPFGPSLSNNSSMQNTTGSPLFTSSPSLPSSPYSTSRRSLDGPSPSIRYFGPTLQPNRYANFRTDNDGHVQI